jgi:hypothetical protein
VWRPNAGLENEPAGAPLLSSGNVYLCVHCTGTVSTFLSSDFEESN